MEGARRLLGRKQENSLQMSTDWARYVAMTMTGRVHSAAVLRRSDSAVLAQGGPAQLAPAEAAAIVGALTASSSAALGARVPPPAALSAGGDAYAVVRTDLEGALAERVDEAQGLRCGLCASAAFDQVVVGIFDGDVDVAVDAVEAVSDKINSEYRSAF
jgi:hypothetical protein